LPYVYLTKKIDPGGSIGTVLNRVLTATNYAVVNDVGSATTVPLMSTL